MFSEEGEREASDKTCSNKSRGTGSSVNALVLHRVRIASRRSMENPFMQSPGLPSRSIVEWVQLL
jgi:hypothetical protein